MSSIAHAFQATLCEHILKARSLSTVHLHPLSSKAVKSGKRILRKIYINFVLVLLGQACYRMSLFHLLSKKRGGSCEEAQIMPIFSLLSSLEEKCFAIAHCYHDTELYETSGFCHSVDSSSLFWVVMQHILIPLHPRRGDRQAVLKQQ